MSVKNLNLPTTDELFTTQSEREELSLEKIHYISLSEIDPFTGHPFKVKDDESMRTLVDSIRTFGIQTPAVVWQKDDKRYELVSGHRRKKACELAGIETMPCIVREMSRDEAIIFMVDSNIQRERILPSEKAKSYKMRLEAMKRQGMRKDLTEIQPAQKVLGKTARQIIGEKTGESEDQIRRFIRLNELTDSLLDMVDEDKLTLRAAVELSYVPLELQNILFGIMNEQDVVPTHSQAVKLRELAERDTFGVDLINAVFDAGKISGQYKIPKDKISKFFAPDTPPNEIQETIVKALEYYKQHVADGQNIDKNLKKAPFSGAFFNI